MRDELGVCAAMLGRGWNGMQNQRKNSERTSQKEGWTYALTGEAWKRERSEVAVVRVIPYSTSSGSSEASEAGMLLWECSDSAELLQTRLL